MSRGSKIQNKRKKLRVQINKPIVSKRDLKHKNKFHLKAQKKIQGKTVLNKLNALRLRLYKFKWKVLLIKSRILNKKALNMSLRI